MDREANPSRPGGGHSPVDTNKSVSEELLASNAVEIGSVEYLSDGRVIMVTSRSTLLKFSPCEPTDMESEFIRHRMPRLLIECLGSAADTCVHLPGGRSAIANEDGEIQVYTRDPGDTDRIETAGLIHDEKMGGVLNVSRLFHGPSQAVVGIKSVEYSPDGKIYMTTSRSTLLQFSPRQSTDVESEFITDRMPELLKAFHGRIADTCVHLPGGRFAIANSEEVIQIYTLEAGNTGSIEISGRINDEKMGGTLKVTQLPFSWAEILTKGPMVRGPVR